MGVVICIIWFRYGYALGLCAGLSDYGGRVADFVAGAGTNIRAKSSTVLHISCSPWAALDRTSFSLLTPMAGRRPCWVTNRTELH